MDEGDAHLVLGYWFKVSRGLRWLTRMQVGFEHYNWYGKKMWVDRVMVECG